MECSSCGVEAVLWTTLMLCPDCYETELRPMSVSKAEARRRCAYRHFTWPHTPGNKRMRRGAFYHDVMVAWLATCPDNIEHAYQACVDVDKKAGMPHPDADGSALRALKGLAGWWTAPRADLILCLDGMPPLPYPAAFRALPLYPGRPHLDRMFAVIVSGKECEDYAWIGAHDLVWLDEDGWLRVIDWKGGKEVDMSILAPIYALCAMRIWRRLKPVGVKVQTIGVMVPWSSPVHEFPADKLPDLDWIALDLSREYYRTKDRGDYKATANEYCGDCPRHSRCPEITGALAVEPRPAGLLTMTLEEAPTAVILEERERWPQRMKEAEAYGSALAAEAVRRVDAEGTSIEGDDDGPVKLIRFLDRVARRYDHPNGGYLYNEGDLRAEARSFGVDPDGFQTLELAPILTHAHPQETFAALDALCQSLGIKVAHAAQVTLDQKGLIEAILDAAVKVKKKAPTERRLKANAVKLAPGSRVTFSSYNEKKHGLIPRCDEPPTCGIGELFDATPPVGPVDPREDMEDPRVVGYPDPEGG